MSATRVGSRSRDGREKMSTAIQQIFSPAILRLHSTLKSSPRSYSPVGKPRDLVTEFRQPRPYDYLLCLSKCHVVISLIMFTMAGLADYVSYRVNTLRLHGLIECCAFYCIVMGMIGIFGSASHRRALIIAFMIMGIHAVIVFVPAMIIVASFDIHFYNRECYGECDWHLLSASLPKDSRCQILCGSNIDDNRRSSMSRLGTDYRLDAGIITFACIELILSVVTTVLCIKQVFGLCSLGQPQNSASATELQLLHEK